VSARGPARRRARGAAAAAALVLAAAALACGGGEEAPAAAPAPVPVAPEDVYLVAPDVIRTGPRIAGTLEARRRADVRAEAGGRVIAVEAELGQKVWRGELLARIEARAQSDAVRAARAQLRSAQEQLALARREVDRTRTLVEGGALPRRDLETAQNAVVAAQAQVGAAEAQLATARSQLADATVRAPMSGVVSAAPVREGDVVAPGGEMFTIIDPGTMRLEAWVPADDLSAIAVGTPVTFEVRGYPGRRFHGAVERVAPAADPVTRQISILVDIPNLGGELVAGLFAEGRLTSGRREGLVVPLAAVDTSGENPVVTRVRDGVVERVAVQTGITDAAGERIEVVSGLAAGDLVLLRSARGLPPGTRVVVPQAEDRPRAQPPGQPRAGAAPRPPAGEGGDDEPPRAGRPAEGGGS